MKKLILFILSFFCINISYSGEIYLYGSEDLSSNLINDVCQDSSGFIWVATAYGLNRFDGYKFNKYYANNNDSTSLSDNYIISVQLNNKDLWICTRRGLHKYNCENDNFKKIHLPREFERSDVEITCFKILSSGTIWLGTSGMGIIEIDTKYGKGVIKDEINKSVGNTFIHYIFEDKNNLIWINSGSKFLRIEPVKEEVKIHIYHLPEMLNSGINTILEDEDGNFILSTEKNIGIYDIISNKVISVFNHTREELRIHKMIKSREGEIYIGTDGQGLLYIDKKNRKF